jgi:hypothetical protein
MTFIFLEIQYESTYTQIFMSVSISIQLETYTTYVEYEGESILSPLVTEWMLNQKCVFDISIHFTL